MIKFILCILATGLLSSAAFAQEATTLPTLDLQASPGMVQTQTDKYYTYDFGSTWVHSPVYADLRLSNTGTMDLQVYQIAITAGDFQAYHSCPAILPPNTYCNIQVIFNPWNEGFKTGRLYADTSAGLMVVDLRGWARR